MGFLPIWATLMSKVQSAPLPYDRAVGVVWTFDNTTWIENIAVRQDGSILATSINRHALYLVDPFAHTAETVHQFDATESLLGISEIDNDIFAVASGNVTITTSLSFPGSSKMWKVDMRSWPQVKASVHSHQRRWSTDRTQKEQSAVSLISTLPKVGTPDGVVTLTHGRNAQVLLADSSQGLVWRVDTVTGAQEIVIQNSAFAASNPMIKIGVDGIHIRENYLYFTNLGNGTLARIPINAQGAATGPIEKIAQLLGVDDFALAADGTAYAVGFNTLYRVTSNKTVTTLAGGIEDLAVEGATSAQLGRTWRDRDVLYMGTSGGLLGAVDGVIHGGQILAINVAQFR